MAHRSWSLCGRIEEFFENCPDEELTHQQMAIKFGVSSSRIFNALSRLAKAGIVEHVRVVRRPEKGRFSKEEEARFSQTASTLSIAGPGQSRPA